MNYRNPYKKICKDAKVPHIRPGRKRASTAIIGKNIGKARAKIGHNIADTRTGTSIAGDRRETARRALGGM